MNHFSRRSTPAVSRADEFDRSFLTIRGDRPVQVLIDPRVRDLPVVDMVLSSIPASHRRIHLVGGDVDMEEIAQLDAEREPGAVVLGIGGGAVIDRAKMVSLLATNRAIERSISPRLRSGFVLLPPAVERSTGLVIMPTTVGTGAEMSSTACVQVGGTKKLVYSTSLRPDLAYITSAATDTLPNDLLLEGVFEILMRVGSYYVGHAGDREHIDRGQADRLAEGLAREVFDLGMQVAESRRQGVRPANHVRERIAMLSGRTHRSEFHEGLEPFTDKCWPLANELSMLTSIRKVTAMVGVGPALWRRIERGGTRWGSVHRLKKWWAVLSQGTDFNVERPSAGLDELVREWELECPEGDVDLSELVKRTETAWAKGLPMLAGISAAEIHAIYRSIFVRQRL